MQLNSLSQNPVQQQYLGMIHELFENNTDDLFDNVNFIAALKKAATAITHESLEWAVKHKQMSRGQFIKMLAHGEKDWEDWDHNSHDMPEAYRDQFKTQ
jgi:hypothetical protein